MVNNFCSRVPHQTCLFLMHPIGHTVNCWPQHKKETCGYSYAVCKHDTNTVDCHATCRFVFVFVFLHHPSCCIFVDIDCGCLHFRHFFLTQNSPRLKGNIFILYECNKDQNINTISWCTLPILFGHNTSFYWLNLINTFCVHIF